MVVQDGTGAPGARQSRQISFTPALPDGQDCPWTRDRRTRWWLVPPADLLATGLVAVLTAASARPHDALPTSVWQAVVGVVLGWVVTWAVFRRRGDHLEMAVPEGLVVTAVTWAAWTVLHVLAAVPAAAGDHLSWAVMTGTFLLVFLGGWRWLYGYVRAHDSLVPAALARRIAAQEDHGEDGAPEGERRPPLDQPAARLGEGD